jgi:hypothetical protein
MAKGRDNTSAVFLELRFKMHSIGVYVAESLAWPWYCTFPNCRLGMREDTLGAGCSASKDPQ